MLEFLLVFFEQFKYCRPFIFFANNFSCHRGGTSIRKCHIVRTSGFGNINGKNPFRNAQRSTNRISMILRAYLATFVRFGSHSHGPALVCESLDFACFIMVFSRVVRYWDGGRPPGAVSSVLRLYVHFIDSLKGAF